VKTEKGPSAHAGGQTPGDGAAAPGCVNRVWPVAEGGSRWPSRTRGWKLRCLGPPWFGDPEALSPSGG
jgi:hypothetical protein